MICMTMFCALGKGSQLVVLYLQSSVKSLWSKRGHFPLICTQESEKKKKNPTSLIAEVFVHKGAVFFFRNQFQYLCEFRKGKIPHAAGWGLNTVLCILDKPSLPLSFILSPTSLAMFLEWSAGKAQPRPKALAVMWLHFSGGELLYSDTHFGERGKRRIQTTF